MVQGILQTRVCVYKIMKQNNFFYTLSSLNACKFEYTFIKTWDSISTQWMTIVIKGE
jgi:hypothetical protein